MKRIFNFNLVCLIATFFMSAQAFAQTYSVSGKVTDAVSTNGLQGVVVTIATKNATTDANGDYTVNDIPGGGQTLKAALANYTIPDQAITVANNIAGQNLVATGDLKELAVTALKARKDTAMLCVDGCKRSLTTTELDTESLWNGSRTTAAYVSPHDRSYCAHVANTMINRFYGGTLTEDECAFKANDQGAPELDLGHDLGTSFSRVQATLSWALQSPTGLTTINTEPTEVQYKGYIDGDQPLLWAVSWSGGGGHAVVMSGYRYVDRKFELKFLNTDNNGRIEWHERGTFGTFGYAFAPPSKTKVDIGRKTDALLALDTDSDGVTDFDEKYRWDSTYDLDEKNVDTDKDGLPDGKDIEGWLFRGDAKDATGKDRFDDDHDGLRGEVDPDSDNGGVRDGDEDANHDANKTNDETDPYEPINPNADDIPKVKITLNPTNQADNKTFVRGNVTATFVFYRKDGTALLPVFDKDAGPLIAKYTPNGGAGITVNLTPTGALPTATWTGVLTLLPTTPAGKAEFGIKNGSVDVEITEGKEFYIDPKGGEKNN